MSEHGLTDAMRRAIAFPLRDRFPAWRRDLLVLLMDACCVGTAFYFAFAIRFEGQIPWDRIAQMNRFAPLLIAIRLVLHVTFGIHRWSFRLSGGRSASGEYE